SGHIHPSTHPDPLSLPDALPILFRRDPRSPACAALLGGKRAHAAPLFSALRGKREIGSAWSTATAVRQRKGGHEAAQVAHATRGDRKSTRLNSSHQIISYAVLCW